MTDNNNNKTDLYKLDGTIIKADGVEYKSNFFKFLDLQPDDYSDISFTPEEAKKIRGHLTHLSTGSAAAIPLYCGGAAVCPFSARCPFLKLDRERRRKDPNSDLITPIGRSCLVEVNLLNEWTRLYIQEYDIQEENFTEFMMVRELAEIELMLWRLNNNLAKPEHATLVQDTVVGIDREGNPLRRQEVTALFEAKERLQNRKSRLIKLMVGDRQEKYKKEAALKMKSEDDPSISSARLRGQIDNLLSKARILDMQLKEAEGKVVDAEYHDAVQTPEDIIDVEVGKK